MDFNWFICLFLETKIYMMKTALLIIVSLFSSSLLVAQNDVYLTIDHKLGTSDVLSSPNSSNNLGDDFSLGRMQYYLSQFVLVHDGGQQTSIPNLFSLVNGKVSLNTEIALGSVSFTEIEEIKFSVGVDSHNNHLDPASYNSTHPLAPQNPSMHWGWTSGYRFVAMEGTTGATNEIFEIHALGDNLYFQVSLAVEAVESNGNYYIAVEADYAKAIQDISIAGGLIEHGSSQKASDLLLNFQTNVFKAIAADTTGNPTGIRNITAVKAVSAFPNPSSGLVNFSLENVKGASQIELYNMLGSLVQTETILSDKFSILQETNGVYLVLIKDANGLVIGRSSVLI
ncbi:MAG: hypothetical protein ACI9QR_001588, partial [Flavobacteriaceae bacterium]